MSMETSELLIQSNWSSALALGRRSDTRRIGVGLTLAERSFLLKVVDLFLINAALVIAVIAWSDFPFSLVALSASFKWFVTLSAVWLLFAAALDVYDLARSASTTQSILFTCLAALLVGMLYIAIPWLTPPVGRRMQAFGFLFLAVGGIAGWRALYAQFFFQPAFQHRVLVVGSGVNSNSLLHELQAAASAAYANPFRGTGYLVVGIIADDAGQPGTSMGDIPTITSEQNLIYQVRHLGVNEIIVANEHNLSPALREAVMDCRELGLRVTPLSVAYERLTARLPVNYAAQNLNIIAGAADNPAFRLFQAGKRVLDVMLALIAIPLLAILVPFIAVANALTAPGPIFYCQQRVGRGGRPFALYKFRTMVPHAEGAGGARWATNGDPRITPVGRWLRRMRLDELPQFINVLRGEMSVVGPRPERPQFVGELSRILPLFRARHGMQPGITGWAQVCYHYGNTVEDARVKLEYDLYYIKHAGFFLDLLILLRTLPVMLHFRGY